MEHLDIVAQYLREPGIEIGAFTTPVPGIKPIYLDRFAEYAGIATLNDYIGDACDLPFYDSSLRYVVTSHVLEHVANPLAALSEWYRVLMHGGIIYAVIPDRRKTFDRNRALTTVDHIYEDFKKRWDSQMGRTLTTLFLVSTGRNSLQQHMKVELRKPRAILPQHTIVV